MREKLEERKPKLRFFEFDGAWEEYKFSQLFSISAGGDIDINKVKTEPDDVYKYPVYANAEKNKGLYGYSNEYKIEPNVITIAGRGVNIGIAHVRDHRFYPIVRLLVLKPKKGLNIYFFEYQINRMNVFVESTGVPQLTAPQISSYKVFSTSIAEQEKIASFLGAVDARLTQLRRKRDRLQTYKRGVMQKIFSQQIRFRGAIGLEFPDWQEKTLGELTHWSSGGTPSKDNLDYWQGDIPWISASSMYEDIFIDSEHKITESGLKNGSRLAVKGSILILVRGSMLYNRIPIGIAGRDVAFNQDVKSLKILSNADPRFLFYYLKSKESLFKSMVSGTGIGAGKLDTTELKNLIIFQPVPKEQEKIADFLTAIDQKIEAISRQIDRTEQFKKGLLQKMFV